MSDIVPGLPKPEEQPWIKLNEKGEIIGLFRFINNHWTDKFEWKDGEWIEVNPELTKGV